MITLLILIFLGMVFLFGFRLFTSGRRVIGVVWTLLAAAGMYFVLNPMQSTAFANMLGVGRGTDLVFYLFACFMTLFAILLAIKISIQERQITGLARQIALLSESSK